MYDTFCILKRGATTELLNHFSALRLKVEFIVELEKDGTLPFLDTLVQKKINDGSLEVTVYRKTIHADQYLIFIPTIKYTYKGIDQLPVQKSKKIITTQESLQIEEEHVVEVLKLNGYRSTFFHAASKALPSKVVDQDVDVEKSNRTP